jgi:hypothetical protein
LVPVFTSYRPDSPSSKNSKGSISGSSDKADKVADKKDDNGRGSKYTKDEKTAATKAGDEAAQNLINETSKIFQSVAKILGKGRADLL